MTKEKQGVKEAVDHVVIEGKGNVYIRDISIELARLPPEEFYGILRQFIARFTYVQMEPDLDVRKCL